MRGEFNLAGIALKQRRTQVGFELPNQATEGRLRYVEPLGCPAEVKLLRHGHEGLRISDIHIKRV
ncbi:hypothetical protein GCM10023063_36680 [Arthrobacter methylotrophus]